MSAYIHRSLEKVIQTVSAQYPVVMVTGPRQVGKTTMLRKLMEGTDRRYVSLDDISTRMLAKTDPEMFLQMHKPPVLIDEVQYAPELFVYIKIHVDKYGSPGDFWLTGSQIFKLMRGVQESLAGRVAPLSLLPLSQAEMYGGDDSCFLVDYDSLKKRGQVCSRVDTNGIFRRIFRGSMPALAVDESRIGSVFYSSYLTTYLQRDIQELSGTLDSLKFLKFITAVAARCSQLLNVADIAGDADLNQKQVKEWLTILETIGLIFYLHPLSNNVLKRLVKTPKLYFYDTGLVCYLTKWSSPETAESGAMNGALLENYVVSEVVKSYCGNGREPFVYYYRDRDAKEIDLILEHDGVLNPVEIKKTCNPDSHIIKTFKVLDKPPLARAEGAVICMKDDLTAFDRNNFIVPVWML